MARQIAIVIGIKKVGNLIPLPGAISGANDFASWATGAGFEVIRITDETEPVSAQAVKQAIRTTLDRPDVSRLFLYFAGHGIAGGLDADYWLLSGAQDDADEAVNLANSLRFARRSGIPHVAVFADACRTAAGKSALGILGSTIFPPRQRTEPTELDRFFAAQSGDPAQEVRFDDNSLQKSFGVFTECLVAALRGDKREAAELVAFSDGRRLAVTAKSLTGFIQLAVADRLLDIPGSANQVPDSQPGSFPPNILSRIDDADTKKTLTVEVDGTGGLGNTEPQIKVLGFDPGTNDFKVIAAGASPLEVHMPAGSLYKIEVTQRGFRLDPAVAGQIFQLSTNETRRPRLELVKRFEMAPSSVPAPSHVRTMVVLDDGSERPDAPSAGVFLVTSRDPLTGRAASEYRVMQAAERPAAVASLERSAAAERAVAQLSSVGRSHFETSTGLTVLGAKVANAWVAGGHDGLFEEGGAWHVRGLSRGEQDRRGVPRATSAVVELADGRFVAAMMMCDFLGTITMHANGVAQISYLPGPGSRFQLPGYEAERAQSALARATVAVQHGRFDVAEDLAGDFAQSLRAFKHFNPTLGIYAAYAYDIARSTDAIADMVRYYEQYEQPVPYDIALLSGRRFADISVPVAPSFPLMTQGWAYLEPDDLHPVLAQVRRSLGRSVWVMPTGDAARALARSLKNEQLQGELL